MTTQAQPGSSLMSSSRLVVAATSSLVGGGLPDPLLLIPQNQSRHRRSRLGAGGWMSGRNGEATVWRELAPLVNPGHLLGCASPSNATACSWHLFCTGDGVGISNSSASRSSRSSLLCRRLKTRRWSWEVREKGQVGALLSAPGLHWRTHVVTASLAPTLACTLA